MTAPERSWSRFNRFWAAACWRASWVLRSPIAGLRALPSEGQITVAA